MNHGFTIVSPDRPSGLHPVLPISGNMTGIELAREVLKTNPGFPIILCTGFSSKVNDEKIREIGIKALCYKPLTKRDMAIKIREVLNHKYKNVSSG